MTPSSIDHPGREGPRPTMLAGLLVAVLVAACGASASASASPSPTLPSSSPTPSNSESQACTSADVRATGDEWGAAAGSRGTDVRVENVGRTSCVLPASPSVSMVGPAGSVLLAASPAPAGSGPAIGPGETIRFSLVISNWCDQSVSLPLRFQLALASGDIEIGDLSLATAEELPPCNGAGQPAGLSTAGWEPG